MSYRTGSALTNRMTLTSAGFTSTTAREDKSNNVIAKQNKENSWDWKLEENTGKVLGINNTQHIISKGKESGV